LNLIDDSGYGYIRDQGEDITKLASGTEIQLEAPDITITGDVDLIGDVYFDEPVENFRADTIYIGDTKLYNTVDGTTVIVTPFDVNPYLNITFDWVDYDPFTTRPLFITPAILLTPIITDNLPPDPNPGALYFNEDSDLYVYAKNNGEYVYIDTTGSLNDGGVGGTLDSAEVADADYRVVLVYDNTLTYYDTVPLVADTTKADYDSLFVDEYLEVGGVEITTEGILQCATLDITSQNILDADSLSIVAAPGIGKIIIPIKAVLYCDYNSATYADGADSYIRTQDCSDGAANIMTIYDDLIKATADKVSLSTDEATVSQSVGILYHPNNDRCLNKSYWLKIGAGFITGNSAFKFKFYYTIADFN